MGYPVEKMIGKETKLYGIIGINAIEHQLQKHFNRYFQKMDIDAKAMPLNIREDDIGFFLNGLKDSKIKGAFFEKEYWQSLYTLLKPEDEESVFAGICDTIEIIDNRYQLSLTQGRALVALLQEEFALEGKTILIVGNTPSAKSFLHHLIQQKPAKIIYASPYIEEMLELMAATPSSIAHDIERLKDQQIEIEADITINFQESPIIARADQKHLDFNLDFDKIVEKIAEIKTKEWS